MKMKVKLTTSLHDSVLKDLRRPHPIARERVGFLSGALGNQDGKEIQIFLTDYFSVPDDSYVADSMVGARINSVAILMAMQRVLDTGKGIFHVHLHDWWGTPGYSQTDRIEIPPIVESCRNILSTVAHGILVLSANKANCLVWPPSGNGFKEADRISAVGHPIRFLEK